MDIDSLPQNMKKILLILFLAFMTCSSFSQTTLFNSKPIVHGKESTRLYSLDIHEDHIIATIEIEALSKCKRINYWTTANTFIAYNQTVFAQIRGYYINGRIEQCGYEHQWGWSNVEKGEKKYYKLYFEGHIPAGLNKISIVDVGAKEWNGSGFSNVHGYCFYDYSINNPRKNYSAISSEQQAKQNVDINNDDICGIYEQIAGSTNYKLACIKENGEYKLVYLSSSTGVIENWWTPGDIKATLSKSASGIFKSNWYMSDKTVNQDTYITFDGISMTVNMPTGTDPGEKKYLKMYPINSSERTSRNGSDQRQDQEWTGTGFALHNGYIITNNHVVDGAKTIAILGVNGNYNIEYNAQVVSVDKNNDLALIKIDDSRFNAFTKVPYAVSNRLCEVGEDVFVLGFPLTSYMGNEIKLTNGIISSRSGYQGDITTYQISAPIQPGNSGGPLFDKQGNIVGVVNAGIPGAENVGYAIKTTYLYNLVENVVSPTNIPQKNQVNGSSLADIVRIVKDCVFYIKCKGK